MTMKKIYLFFVVFFFFANIAQAETVGVAAKQTVFSFDLNPGSEKDFSVDIQNISQSGENVSVESEDFSFGNNNEISSIVEVNELNGMRSWVSVERKNLILASKESTTIPIKIKIPSDATVGSHYSLVAINFLPMIDGQNFQSTMIGGRIGIYILVNVKGEVSGKGVLKNFSTPIITSDNANIKADFQNEGNIHYIPHGEIQIQNLFTRKTQTLETEKHFVFPGKKYSFELQWKPTSIFSAYKAQAFFVDGNGVMHQSQRFMFGKLFFIIPSLLIVSGIFWILRKRRLQKI